MNRNNKKGSVMSRKYVLSYLVVIVVIGLLFGFVIYQCLNMANLASLLNLSLCMLVYLIFCLCFWVPLIVPMQQIMEIREDSIAIILKNKDKKKAKIVWYALINDTIEPYYDTILLKDIEKVTLNFNANMGSYGFHRFSYYLLIQVKEEKIKVFLNPMQNGFLLPSGYGMPCHNRFSKEDIVNLMTYFNSNDVIVSDPYHLVEAMKDKNVVMYDYLISLHKKISY